MHLKKGWVSHRKIILCGVVNLNLVGLVVSKWLFFSLIYVVCSLLPVIKAVSSKTELKPS